MSTMHARVKRTPASRTGPNRNPLYPGAKSAEDVCGPEKALENGVKAAYAVIDEYIRRGREEARKRQADPFSKGNMNNYKSQYHHNASHNPWGAMPMLAEQMMGAMRMWTSVWSAFLPPGFPQQAWNPAEMWGQAQAKPSAVSVHVSASCPTEVTAYVRPGCEGMQLVASPLMKDGDPSMMLKQIAISRDSYGAKVNVTVPAGQAAGTYCGPIRELMNGADAGYLTVKVFPPPGQSA